MKTFNTAGTCRPNEHYMVDITERLEIIRKMVAKGDYFCINRGRQYGKTTTLTALQNTLEKLGYTVFSLSFEGMSEDSFQSLNTVLHKLVQKINDCILWDEAKNISETSKALLDELEKSD
ncbi:MAG: AAA-like domain-containing protein, partial [Bacteroidales bacterium]|nr:AAA-like domain-containing protein [Bacteroidales bacterium]